MDIIINKRTLEYREVNKEEDTREVDLNDFNDDQWLVNPSLTAVKDIPRKYWKVSNDKVVKMTDSEKMATELSNPNPFTKIGFTGVINNPTKLKIVNGIIVEAS